MIKLRKSKVGFIMSSIFLLLAVGVVGWLMYSAHTNPTDSGEGGILLIPFISPWFFMLQGMYANSLWLFPVLILLNAFIIYCVFGGLRWEKKC